MTTDQGASLPARPIARRSWLRATRTLALLTASLAAATLFVLSQPVGGFDGGETGAFLRLVTSLGTEASVHLASAMGVVATVLFGILIAIIGSQVVLGDAEAETSVKSALGLIATASLLAMVPALTVAVVAAADSAAVRGALLVDVPILVALGALVVVINTIEPGDDPTLLRLAEREQQQAQARLALLAPLPARSIWPATLRTTAVPAAVVVVIAAGLLLVPGTEPAPALDVAIRAFVLAAVFLGATVSMLVAVNAELKAGSGTVHRANAAVYLAIGAGLYALGVTTAWGIWRPVGLGMLGGGLVLLLLAARALREARAVREGIPRQADSWWNGGPMVQGGTGMAHTAAQRLSDTSDARAEELRRRLAAREPAPATAPAPSPRAPARGARHRLRRAIAELVRED